MEDYKKSLQARYPPVCNDCEQSVDEEITSKEHMARTSALGRWLKRSQHAGIQRSAEQQRGRREVLIWRVRGGLFLSTVLAFVAVSAAGEFLG